MGTINRRGGRNSEGSKTDRTEAAKPAHREHRRYEPKGKEVLYQHPKWTPPAAPPKPLETLRCAYCEKTIRDSTTVFMEPNIHQPVHFDCVLSRLGECELLEKGDSFSYIGGGRFAVVHFSSRTEKRTFRIKKIIEYEPLGTDPEWRQTISDHYSMT
ncbi:hypothetical protein FACS1894164_05120 [Spirochaetia bacterium]|nr:hypothetical protein FACS1894164_05120 [Spirochaetia bacterium]